MTAHNNDSLLPVQVPDPNVMLIELNGYLALYHQVHKRFRLDYNSPWISSHALLLACGLSGEDDWRFCSRIVLQNGKGMFMDHWLRKYPDTHQPAHQAHGLQTPAGNVQGGHTSTTPAPVHEALDSSFNHQEQSDQSTPVGKSLRIRSSQRSSGYGLSPDHGRTPEARQAQPLSVRPSGDGLTPLPSSLAQPCKSPSSTIEPIPAVSNQAAIDATNFINNYFTSTSASKQIQTPGGQALVSRDPAALEEFRHLQQSPQNQQLRQQHLQQQHPSHQTQQKQQHVERSDFNHQHQQPPHHHQQQQQQPPPQQDPHYQPGIVLNLSILPSKAGPSREPAGQQTLQVSSKTSVPDSAQLERLPPVQGLLGMSSSVVGSMVEEEQITDNVDHDVVVTGQAQVRLGQSEDQKTMMMSELAFLHSEHVRCQKETQEATKNFEQAKQRREESCALIKTCQDDLAKLVQQRTK